MSTTNTNTNADTDETSRLTNRPPKHGAARMLWLMSLDEWHQFQSGDLTADELKQRYSGVSTEQTDISSFAGGDDE